MESDRHTTRFTWVAPLLACQLTVLPSMARDQPSLHRLPEYCTVSLFDLGVPASHVPIAIQANGDTAGVQVQSRVA